MLESGSSPYPTREIAVKYLPLKRYLKNAYLLSKVALKGRAELKQSRKIDAGCLGKSKHSD
jgi:hypothetical protein